MPRYLAKATYSTGWDDGFRQCQGLAQDEEQQRFDEERLAAQQGGPGA